jgi:predicted HicB family RNase H-like nuclease
MVKKRKRTRAQIAADKLRTGRPPKPPEQTLSERVMVRLSRAERARLEALAKKEGLSLASLIMRPWREEKR